MRADEDSSIERLIVTGLIVSDDFLKRIAPSWRDEFLETPELVKVVRWCLDYFKRYSKAPGRHLEDVLMQELQANRLGEAEAKLIDLILSRIDKDYDNSRNEQLNPDYLFDRAVEYFRLRVAASVVDDLEEGVERGDDAQVLRGITKVLRPVVHRDPVEPIDAVREAMADCADALAGGDISRARVAAWRAASVGAPIDELPDPFGDPEPPPFDRALLPPILRRFAEAKARSIGVDLGPMAWSALAACSAALPSSIRLRMKVNDLSYTVPPGIWFLLVGNPSSRKTPVLENAFSPLFTLQGERLKRCSEERRRWEKEDPKKRGPEPRVDQLITNGATTEGLRDLLARQDCGVISFNDEMSSHIGSMGRYSGGKDAGAADRAFFNVAYTGGPFIVNRSNRRGGEQIAVNNLQVTVVGGIQPDLICKFNQDNALLIDGMLQRSCPILMGKAKLGEDVEIGPVWHRYEKLVRHLAEVPGDQRLHFTPEAQAIREDVEKNLFIYEQMRTVGQGFTTAIGKLNGIFGRLALTLAYVEAYPDIPDAVDFEAASQAQQVVFKSLIPNMLEFYNNILGGAAGSIETTRNIATYLLRHECVRVTAAEIVRGVRLKNRKVDEVRNAMSPLVGSGWLTPVGNEDERRVREWDVNPTIYVQFSARAAQAKMEAEILRDLIADSVRARREDRAGTDADRAGFRTSYFSEKVRRNIRNQSQVRNNDQESVGEYG